MLPQTRGPSAGVRMIRVTAWVLPPAVTVYMRGPTKDYIYITIL